MLSYQTIEPHTLELLKAIICEPIFKSTCLVGGTSLALQYGHRSSIDLDFFGTIDCDTETVKEALRKHGDLLVIKETPSIKVFQLDGVKIDFVNYKYQWIDNFLEEDGLRLASSKDIAAMKINAIEGRGSKKDFVDIYFLLQHYSLKEILDFYVQKYPESSIFRAIMSLTYFEDAEIQQMPKMFEPVTWEVVKQKMVEEVNRLK